MSRRISIIQNGVTPLKIVAVDTSPTTPLSTKKVNPTGGVIRLIVNDNNDNDTEPDGIKSDACYQGKENWHGEQKYRPAFEDASCNALGLRNLCGGGDELIALNHPKSPTRLLRYSHDRRNRF